MSEIVPFLHTQNYIILFDVSFLEYVYQFARHTRNKKPTKVTKTHISFPEIEIEIKTSIKSTLYNSAETWGKSWG